MRAMTDRQKRAVDVYFTAFAQYRRIVAMGVVAPHMTKATKQEARCVDEAAWAMAHDSAGDMAQTFAMRGDVPFEIALEFLMNRKSPPPVETLVATMREIATASRRSNAGWGRWVASSPLAASERARFPQHYAAAA